MTSSQKVPCNSDPQISLTFGGKAFAIPTNTFNLGQLFQGSEDCVGGITGTTNIPSECGLCFC